MCLVLPNYIFTYNGNQYVRVTPYSHDTTTIYKFSDGSDIGQVKKSDGDSSNYRFFEIQPIKWIVLNYNKGFDEPSNTKDELTVGTMKRYELLANDVLMSGITPGDIIWEHNTINDYMNNYMFSKMFSNSEQQLVEPAIIYNNTNEADSNLDTTGSNSNYLTDGFNSTTQNLYLLSRYEVVNSSGPYAGLNKVFRNADDRTPLASDYARAHNQALNATTGKANFWFRTTTGTNIYYSTNASGLNNHPVTTTSIGTRPAMQLAIST